MGTSFDLSNSDLGVLGGSTGLVNTGGALSSGATGCFALGTNWNEVNAIVAFDAAFFGIRIGSVGTVLIEQKEGSGGKDN